MKDYYEMSPSIQLLKGVVGGGLSLLAYFGLIMSAQLLPELYSEKIIGRENIERVFIEEKKKLKLENKEIALFIFPFDGCPGATKTRDGYLISLDSVTNRETIKHELYHIEDGHCDGQYWLLKYLFWNEPQATIYSLTGLKL